MMKKITVVLLSLLMMLCLAACGDSGNGKPSGGEDPVDTIADNDTPPESSSVENGENASTPRENGMDSTNLPESTGTSEVQPDGGENTESRQGEENADAQGTKVLVAYFSATNTTEGVAVHIANGLNADIYEIIPKEPYTDADLNYNDNKSRTTIEMNDPAARPAISGSVENMEQYDIVFLGS